MPPLVINEFNVMVYGHDMGEFIEISSLGIPKFPLNDIIVVSIGVRLKYLCRFGLSIIT